MSESVTPLVSIRQLEKRFDLSGGLLDQLRFRRGRLVRHREYVHALNGVDLDIVQGEALCVVGESGCGKSTVARVVMGLLSPSAGEVYYEGQRIDNLSRTAALPGRWWLIRSLWWRMNRSPHWMCPSRRRY